MGPEARPQPLKRNYKRISAVGPYNFNDVSLSPKFRYVLIETNNFYYKVTPVRLYKSLGYELLQTRRTRYGTMSLMRIPMIEFGFNLAYYIWSHGVSLVPLVQLSYRLSKCNRDRIVKLLRKLETLKCKQGGRVSRARTIKSVVATCNLLQRNPYRTILSGLPITS